MSLFFVIWVSCCLTSCASVSCFSRSAFRIDALVCFGSSVADPFWFWTMIRATRDVVTCLDDYELKMDWTARPRPPNIGGRASSRHSKGDQGVRPVMAGKKCWWITSSKGHRKSSILGMVLHMYVHLLVMPWLKSLLLQRHNGPFCLITRTTMTALVKTRPLSLLGGPTRIKSIHPWHKNSYHAHAWRFTNTIPTQM